jgi:hypothetical protein
VFQKANISEENKSVLQMAQESLMKAKRGCTSKDAPIADRKQNSEDKSGVCVKNPNHLGP